MIDVARETLITFQEAARRLRVCIGTVRNHARRGLLEQAQLGERTKRTSLEALQRYVVTRGGKVKPSKSVSQNDAKAREYLRKVHGI